MSTVQAPTSLGAAKMHGRLVLIYVRTRPRPGRTGALYDVCLSVDGRESVLLESAADIEFANKVCASYNETLAQIMQAIIAKENTQ